MSPFPALVDAEVRLATDLHPPLANHDEALSVLCEEVHEVEAEVFKNQKKRVDADLLSELVQVAAMARRWCECCGLEVVLGAKFPAAAAASLVFLRREAAPASSDHESLSRLKRLMRRIEWWAAIGGPDLIGRQQDVALALAVVAATCQRWAEDRKLVPPDPARPPEPPGVAATTVPPPDPTPPEAADAAAQEAV